MSISKSQTDQIGSIFNGNKFIIPSYQRKYSWTLEECKALWEDIAESSKDDMNHFIGTLSFKENKTVGLASEPTYEIIDGQQRITTLFLLISVLIDRLESKEMQETLLAKFIGSKDYLRLCPLGIDGDFLKQLLFEYKEIDSSKLTKRSHKYMYAAKANFLALCQPLSQSAVEAKIVYIRDRMDVLVFNVDSQAQAVKMFSIINDRGLPLRVLDKTKSILMLYSTLHLKEKLNSQINDRFENIFDAYDDLLVWKDKLGILVRFEENTIFTQHYYSARRLFLKTWNNRDGAETVFLNLKQQCSELKEDPAKLEAFIKDYLQDFEAFSIAFSDLIKAVEKTPAYQKPFQFLEFTGTLYPLLIRLYMQGKLDGLLQILTAVEVRVYKLKGTNPIADMYALSSSIAESDWSIGAIKQQLVNFNEKFVNDYSLKIYLDDNIYTNGAVKFILSEYTLNVLDIDAYKNMQVEHIFSKDPNYDPTAYGFNDDYEFEKGRIGNLALLEADINSGLGNSAPINKVDGYLRSAINETRLLAGEIQQGNYTKQNVDERRQRIIDFCIRHFTVS